MPSDTDSTTTSSSDSEVDKKPIATSKKDLSSSSDSDSDVKPAPAAKKVETSSDSSDSEPPKVAAASNNKSVDSSTAIQTKRPLLQRRLKHHQTLLTLNRIRSLQRKMNLLQTLTLRTPRLLRRLPASLRRLRRMCLKLILIPNPRRSLRKLPRRNPLKRKRNLKRTRSQRSQEVSKGISMYEN